MTTGTAVAMTAGVTESAADSGSGEALEHLVRDEPVPDREPQSILLPEQ